MLKPLATKGFFLARKSDRYSPHQGIRSEARASACERDVAKATLCPHIDSLWKGEPNGE
jgi:hypothetical protein